MAASTTRDELVITAERLFAERGIDAVSLRQIAEAAGQRNPFVVQYHFGTKTDLLRAIIEYRVGPYNERRLALVEALDAAGKPLDLRGLVEASVLPFIELEPAGSHYVRFLARLASHTLAKEVFDGLSDESGFSARVIEERLDQALADVPGAMRANRTRVALGIGLAALAEFQHRVAAGEPGLISPELFVDDLIQGVTAYLAAPVSERAVALAGEEPRGLRSPPRPANTARSL